jgi:hypothetical protein
MKTSEQVVMNASERTVRTVHVTLIVILTESEYFVVEESDSVWFLFLLWTIDRRLIS